MGMQGVKYIVKYIEFRACSRQSQKVPPMPSPSESGQHETAGEGTGGIFAEHAFAMPARYPRSERSHFRANLSNRDSPYNWQQRFCIMGTLSLTRELLFGGRILSIYEPIVYTCLHCNKWF